MSECNPPRPAGNRPIVDSQVHLWDHNSAERPWVPNLTPQIPDPMTIERMLGLMDQAGVDRVIVVPPNIEGLRIDYPQKAAELHPGRFGLMPRIVVNNPGEADRLKKIKTAPAVLGYRLYVTGGQKDQFAKGEFDWLWHVLEEIGLPVAVLTAGQTGLMGPIAQRHPGLHFMIDHCGVAAEFIGKAADKAEAVRQCVNEVANLSIHENVSVKLSSTPLFSGEDYPFADVRDHVRRLFEIYGPTRSYWGSDLTNGFAKATYQQRVTQFTDQMDFLSEQDKDWVMGRAIMERLNWA